MHQNKQKDPSFVLGCRAVIALVLILVCSGLLWSGGCEQSSQPRTSRPRTGQVATLSSESGLRIPVAASSEALDRYIDLERADDNVGITAMRLNGLVRFIPSGTKCKVIKRGFTTYEVRLTEGEYNGQSCFVVAGFVNRD